MPHKGKVGGSGGSPPVVVLEPARSPVPASPLESVEGVVSVVPWVGSSSLPLPLPLPVELAVVTAVPGVLVPRESDVDELLLPDPAASGD